MLVSELELKGFSVYMQVEVLNQMLVRCGGAGAAERLQNQLAALYREIKAVADGVQTSQVSVDEETAKSFRIEKDEEQMTEEVEMKRILMVLLCVGCYNWLSGQESSDGIIQMTCEQLHGVRDTFFEIHVGCSVLGE